MDFHDIVKMQKVKLKIKSVESNLLFDSWLQLANRFNFKWYRNFCDLPLIEWNVRQYPLIKALSDQEIICLSL